jgi:hypothetical protein
MDKLEIEGGGKLNGVIQISGAKKCGFASDVRGFVNGRDPDP